MKQYLSLGKGFIACLFGLSLLAGACGSSGPSLSYDHKGPHVVGATTLDLGPSATYGERMATVFYPADAKAAMSHGKFSYDQASTLPTALRGVLPARFNSVTKVNAYLDAPASKSGPYPVVLFSHGFGGQRLYYSTLLAGIASWGYVVVSADYLERGLAAQASGSSTRPPASLDQQIMFSSLAAVKKASGSASSPLHGVANTQEVATAGHSAGGRTAFDALADPRVKVAIGWAPVGPSATPVSKPSMIITAKGDLAIPSKSVERVYASFPTPKALVQVGGEGHNTYTDICTSIRAGGGLIGYAVAQKIIKPELAKLGINGCEHKDIPAVRFWPIVQAYTVTELQAYLHKGDASLASPSEGQFPGFTVSIHQQ
ncbi:MAG: dienelactone hydrolase family protein [Actinomycetota bacterium]